ncbi:MAG: hypothetical protein U0797_07360 [Gemmataceae bacterium]
MRLGRRLHLIGESDLNDPRVIRPREPGGLGLDAQWSDDFHHALHAHLTGERGGYYADHGSLEGLAKAYRDNYVLTAALAVPPAPLRGAGGRPARRAVRHLRPEPRPGRQPPARRPAQPRWWTSTR